MLKILLAEDHNIVRNCIRMLLEADENIAVVAEVLNGKEALTAITSGLEVDVVLTDINMPEIDGLTLIREVKLNFPNIKLIVLSMHDNEKYILEAFREGATGYLLKNVSSDELLFTIKHIHMGGKHLCSELTMKMIDNLLQADDSNHLNPDTEIDFTVREIEVLNLIARGMTNAEMAEKLFISKRTIEGHRQSLIEKTGVRNTPALIRYAVSYRLIT